MHLRPVTRQATVPGLWPCIHASLAVQTCIRGQTWNSCQRISRQSRYKSSKSKSKPFQRFKRLKIEEFEYETADVVEGSGGQVRNSSSNNEVPGSGDQPGGIDGKQNQLHLLDATVFRKHFVGDKNPQGTEMDSEHESQHEHEPDSEPQEQQHQQQQRDQQLPHRLDASVFQKHFVVDKTPRGRKPTKFIPRAWLSTDEDNEHGAFVHTNEFDLFKGGIAAVVEIGNPHTANFLSSATLRKLTRVFNDDLAKRDRLRVVILTGSKTTSSAAEKAPAFSAGADIKEIQALASEQEARAFITNVYNACEAVRKCPVPVIARIDGACYGTALELSACCDFRFGTARSLFGLKEVALGMPSVVQARLMANIIGWSATKKMVLLAQDYTAKYMYRIGLLDGCFHTSVYMDHHIDRVVNLIAKNAPKATRAQKQLTRFWEENSLDKGLVQGIDTFAQAWAGPGGSLEPKQYIRAWLDREVSRKGPDSYSDRLQAGQAGEAGERAEGEEGFISEQELQKPRSWNFLKLRTYLEDHRNEL